MEEHGGPGALKMIKFSIPLCKLCRLCFDAICDLFNVDESCMKKPDAHHHRDGL